MVVAAAQPSKSSGGFDYFEFKGIQSGRCITVKNRGTTNGSQLLQYTCGQTNNALWTWKA